MDGRYSGQLTPGKFVFKHPENHTFELRLENFSKELNLNISDSEDIDVDLTTGFFPIILIPIAGPHANIIIDSNPRGAEVWKDNVSTNKSTPFSEVSGVFELHTYELRLNNHIDKFTLFTDRNIKINVSI